MKKINTLLIALVLLLTTGILRSQTYDLQFVEILNNGTNYDVKIQIQGSAEFLLASSNITFNFNLNGLNSPSLLVAHNFDANANPSSLYDEMTVTNPNDGVASINIVLTVNRSSFATAVPTTWVDVATVRFTTSNSSLNSGLSFRNVLPSNTVVYSCTGNLSTFQTFLLDAGTWSTLDNPLPVELSSFTSKLINDKVQLNWETKTEVSNYGFNVEKSLKDGEWSTIGFVEGYGNSNSTKFYSFSDKDLFAGGSEFRYRLKQIDTDGKFEYSDVVAVTVIPTQFELAQNYPNPFNPSTTIRFSLPQSAQIKLNVYNLLGQQIATIAEGLFEQGFHKVEFNADNLSSGAYIYRIESSDPSTGSRNGQAGQSFVQVKKMVLIK